MGKVKDFLKKLLNKEPKKETLVKHWFLIETNDPRSLSKVFKNSLASLVFSPGSEYLYIAQSFHYHEKTVCPTVVYLEVSRAAAMTGSRIVEHRTLNPEG